MHFTKNSAFLVAATAVISVNAQTPQASIGPTGASATSAVSGATGVAPGATAGPAPTPLDAAMCSISASESTGTRQWPFCGCTNGVGGLMLVSDLPTVAYCGQAGQATWGAIGIDASLWSSIAAQASTAKVDGTANAMEPSVMPTTTGQWTAVASPSDASLSAVGFGGASASGGASESAGLGGGYPSTTPSVSGSPLNATGAAVIYGPADSKKLLVSLAAAIGFFAFYV